MTCLIRFMVLRWGFNLSMKTLRKILKKGTRMAILTLLQNLRFALCFLEKFECLCCIRVTQCNWRHALHKRTWKSRRWWILHRKRMLSMFVLFHFKLTLVIVKRKTDFTIFTFVMKNMFCYFSVWSYVKIWRRETVVRSMHMTFVSVFFFIDCCFIGRYIMFINYVKHWLLHHVCMHTELICQTCTQQERKRVWTTLKQRHTFYLHCCP